MNIFLDDIRDPKEIYDNKDWVIVRNHNDLVSYIIENGMPELISFDHDLSYLHYLYQDNIDYDKINKYEKTGYDSVKWICNYALNNNIKLPKMLFHSYNPVGKKNMIEYHKNFIKNYPELK